MNKFLLYQNLTLSIVSFFTSNLFFHFLSFLRYETPFLLIHLFYLPMPLLFYPSLLFPN